MFQFKYFTRELELDFKNACKVREKERKRRRDKEKHKRWIDKERMKKEEFRR